MSPAGYEALRAAVTFARNDGCRSVESLRLRLGAFFAPEVAEEAIMHWANYEASKGLAALRADQGADHG